MSTTTTNPPRRHEHAGRRTLGGLLLALGLAVALIPAAWPVAAASSGPAGSSAGAQFGDVEVGATTSATVSILDVGTAPLMITSLSVTGTNAADFGVTSNACTTVNPSDSCTAVVSFEPSMLGDESASLVSEDNSSTGSESFPLSGTGTAGPPPDYFSPTGSMTIPRGDGVMSAPLADGDVLVAGGLSLGYVTAAAELYDPRTGTFTATGSMTVPRENGFAARLPNGDVLVGGGDNSTGWLASAELYDPAEGTFSPAGSLPLPLMQAAAAPLRDGDVLVAGGETTAGFGPNDNSLTSAWLYDPATGTFSQTGSMTTARSGEVAVPLADGDVLVAGGWNNGVGYYQALDTAELYDPSTGSFSAIPATLVSPRSVGGAAPLANGEVLIAGGQFNGGYLAEAEIYDPVSEIFRAVQPLPLGDPFGSLTSFGNGEVLIAGDLSPDGYYTDENEALVYAAPEASSSGAAFGDVPLGTTSAPETVTVANVGARTLLVDAVTFGGDSAGQFALSPAGDECAGTTVKPGSSCTLQVTFTPDDDCPASATVALTDNSGAGIETFPLSGTGTGGAACSPPRSASGGGGGGASPPTSTTTTIATTTTSVPLSPAIAEVELVSCRLRPTTSPSRAAMAVVSERCTEKLVPAPASRGRRGNLMRSGHLAARVMVVVSTVRSVRFVATTAIPPGRYVLVEGRRRWLITLA